MKKYLNTVIFSFLLFGISAQTTADFENFGLQNNEYLNGSDLSGGFTSGNVFVPNNYYPAWDGWDGWAVSTMKDSLTPGFTNQFSAITAKGVNGSDTYVVSYAPAGSILHLENDAKGEPLSGLYITNSTYAYLSMRDGDSFAKKFGGAIGNDPDYLSVTIKKYLDGELSLDSIEFFLADYRFEDNDMDYIIKEWVYLDLSILGSADSLYFEMRSTDNSTFGMNTPAYFCVDNIVTSDGILSIQGIEEEHAKIYPNPASDYILIDTDNVKAIQIFDSFGNSIMQKEGNEEILDITELPSGQYILKIKYNDGIISTTISVMK